MKGIKKVKIQKYNQFNEAKKMTSLHQPTDAEIQEADEYLAKGIGSDWDYKNGHFIIDITGKYNVYYTLWKFNPKSIYNTTHFITNLSTDFMTAVQKAKKTAGRVPVIIDKFGTQAGMFQAAKAELITFGKYRGKTLGDVFVEDPQYILWLSKNYNGKNQDRKEKIEYYKNLYFETLTKKNVEESKSEFIGKIGDKIIIKAKIYDVRSEVSNFTSKMQYKCKLVDDAGNKYMTYNIGQPVKKDDEVKMTAKVKDHTERLGVKFTLLYYCKITSLANLKDDMDKYNL